MFSFEEKKIEKSVPTSYTLLLLWFPARAHKPKATLQIRCDLSWAGL